MEGAHVIDINQLINSFVTKENGCLIHRIGIHIRNKHKTAYEPVMLVIGPYNHGILDSTYGMKLTKYEFLNYVLSFNGEKSLADYIEAIKEMEERVRKFYADDIDHMDRNEFRKLLLLDGCFMLAYLHMSECSVEEIERSNEISNSGINTTCDEDGHEDAHLVNQLGFQDSWRDLLLLENQIPFFVIAKINELVAGGSSTTSAILIEKAVALVENGLSRYPNASFKHQRPKEFYHLLHLCHMYFEPSNLGEAQNCESQVKLPLLHNVPKSIDEDPWHRATEYNQARIGFRKRVYSSENPHCLLDIVFCNGMIEIPGLTIDPTTQTLFCNLIALERSCPQFGSYVTAYIIFLFSLISMPEDVSLLTEDGIIMHQLNSDGDVCDLFREIRECSAANFEEDDHNYLKPLYYRIEAHYRSQRSSLGQLFAAIPSKIAEKRLGFA